MTALKEPLTLQRILIGDPDRQIPDEIDLLVMGELKKAGDQGTTMVGVAENSARA